MFDYVYENKDIVAKSISVDSEMPPVTCVESVFPFAWSEHCLECAAPACYKTCLLFEKNRYGCCKRTEYGIRRICFDHGLYKYAVQLKFKKWGKLLCSNHWKIFNPKVFRRLYSFYECIRNILFYIGTPLNCLPLLPKDLLARLIHHQLMKYLSYQPSKNKKADGLLISIYSDIPQKITLLFDVKDNNQNVLGREQIILEKGINNQFIPAHHFPINNENAYTLEVYPSDNMEPELIFFWLDKIIINKNDEYGKELFRKFMPASKIKCVVWDLDNTLWDGVIGDDGIDKIQLRNESIEAIRYLDEHGILCSIASKNDYNTAWKGVEKFGLADYFLFPQINWEAKSKNLQQIANQLNINIDTLAFIDDSPLERNEIRSLCPNVRVYSETEIKNMLADDAIDVSVTEDSRKRRQYYLTENLRKQSLKENSQTDYRQFIKDCQYIVEVFLPSENNELERCLELIQRTNQLNSSGRRLDRKQLVSLMNESCKKIEAFRCKDRFGEYGIVGCYVIDLTDGILITDFVMSCRVAGKKIESALLKSLFIRYENKNSCIRMKYVTSERNGVLKNELLAIGGKLNELENTILFSQNEIIDSNLISIIVEGDT